MKLHKWSHEPQTRYVTVAGTPLLTQLIARQLTMYLSLISIPFTYTYKHHVIINNLDMYIATYECT